MREEEGRGAVGLVASPKIFDKERDKHELIHIFSIEGDDRCVFEFVAKGFLIDENELETVVFDQYLGYQRIFFL